MPSADSSFALLLNDENVQSLVLKKQLGFLTIESHNELSIPAGAIRDGRIKKPQVLTEAVQGLIGQADLKLLNYRAVNLALPDSRVKIDFVKVPARLSKAESVIKHYQEGKKPPSGRWSDYRLDIAVKPFAQTGGQREIMVGMVPAEIIREYSQVFAKIGLSIKGLDMESLALVRSLVWPKLVNHSVVVIDIGTRLTNLAWYHQGYIHFKRDFCFGGCKLTETLKKSLGVSWIEAERQKRECGFGLKHRGVREALAWACGPTFGEIKQFICCRPSARPDLVILAGGCSLIPGLDNFLQKNLGLPVRIGDPFTEWKIKAKNLLHPPVFYAPLVGLALPRVRPEIAALSFNFMQK